MLSEHFTVKEMSCRGKNCCGHSHPMDNLFLILLDRVRKESGGPVNVNSGFRCKTHNKEIGGVDNSNHTKGTSADCEPTACTIDELTKIARKYFNEVIKCGTFVHIALEK
jgi:uncharacterized protein YcbK (DUF882 family)